MIDISVIDKALTEAMKAKNAIAVDTLRGLKTRIQNEQIAKGQPLAESDLVALVRSEVKRRKEAAQSFETGSRPEMAQKELAEAEILSAYLPAGPSDADIQAGLDALLASGTYTQKDFGALMGKLKSQFPNADGASLSQLLKSKLM